LRWSLAFAKASAKLAEARPDYRAVGRRPTPSACQRSLSLAPVIAAAYH
jgi:hypothetical protein